MVIIVSYDIIVNSKRTKLAKKLQDFGERVQYSVFECNLDNEQIEELKKQTLKFVDLEKDSLRIYRICETCKNKVESFGIKKGWEKKDENEVIVV